MKKYRKTDEKNKRLAENSKEFQSIAVWGKKLLKDILTLPVPIADEERKLT